MRRTTARKGGTYVVQVRECRERETHEAIRRILSELRGLLRYGSEILVSDLDASDGHW